jgi:hypothetical protein
VRGHATLGPLALGFLLVLGALTVSTAPTNAAPRPDQCVLCHRGIEDAHPKRALTCTECHRGDAKTANPEKAHAGMWANPSDLRVVAQTCGTCHQGIAQKVKASIMAHRSGTQSGTLFPNGLQPTREGVRFSLAPEPTRPADIHLAGGHAPAGHPRVPGTVPQLETLPTFQESGDVFFDLLRKECASCHLWSRPTALKGNFRATGCAACHMPYGEDGRYAGGDQAMSKAKAGRPLRHQLTKAIPVTQCATCHNGGSRAAMNLRGMMEAPPVGKETFTYDQDLLHGHSYTQQTPDVHYTRGLACIDCHTEREVHGDGRLYAKRQYEVEVRCESCHGTPERLATGMTAQGRRLRNLFVAAAPNPTGLVTLVSKLSGQVWRVPQLAALPGQPAGHDPGHLNTVECFTCHTAWAPTCYGCHIKMDYSAYRNPVDVSFDHVANEHSQQGWFRLTAGVRFADPEPVLGMSWRGKVVPFVPRAQPLFTYVNPAGQTEYAFRKLGFAHNPIVPHTVVKTPRTCASCHGTPRALGLGAFTSQEHPKLEEFRQPRDYRWDRIVDEDGRPQQATTVEGARPFTREEMDRIRTAPYKLPSSVSTR